MNLFLILAIVAVVAILMAVFFVKRLILLLLNSVIGLFALMGWNVLFAPVKINLLSVLLVALFGIVGLIVVVGLHLLGVYF